MASTRADGNDEIAAIRTMAWTGLEDEITGGRTAVDATLALNGRMVVIEVRSKGLLRREDVIVDLVGQACSAGGQKLGHDRRSGRVDQGAPGQHTRYAINVVMGDKEGVGDERRWEEPTDVDERRFAAEAPHGD